MPALVCMTAFHLLVVIGLFACVFFFLLYAAWVRSRAERPSVSYTKVEMEVAWTGHGLFACGEVLSALGTFHLHVSPRCWRRFCYILCRHDRSLRTLGANQSRISQWW